MSPELLEKMGYICEQNRRQFLPSGIFPSDAHHRYQALRRDVLPTGDWVGFRVQRSEPGCWSQTLGPRPFTSLLA